MKSKFHNILLLILALIGQVHLICNSTAFFIPWFLVFIIIAVSTALLIIIILISKQKRERNIILSITLIIGLTLGFFLSNYQDKQRTVSAENLIKALDQYKFNTGAYPTSDKKLIPKYLLKIPTNNWGFLNVGFQYATSQNKTTFSIQYHTREADEYYYTSSIEEWQFAD